MDDIIKQAIERKLKELAGNESFNPADPVEEEPVLTEAEQQAKYIATLRDGLSRFTYDPIKVGDLVMWKKGMRNRQYPQGPCIITKVIDPPVFDDEKSPSSAYYGEPLTMQVATIVDGALMEFLIDGRRFELVKE